MVDLALLRRELARLPTLTEEEVRAVVADLARATRQAEKAARRAGGG